MSNRHPTYRVVFWGEVMLGRAGEDVARQFAKWFKIEDSRKLRQVFSGRLLVLKKGLSYQDATLYSDVIRGLGAMCRIEPERIAFAEPSRITQIAEIAATKPVVPVELQLVEEGLAQEDHANPFAARDILVENHPPCKYYDPHAASAVLKKAISGS